MCHTHPNKLPTMPFHLENIVDLVGSLGASGRRVSISVQAGASPDGRKLISYLLRNKCKKGSIYFLKLVKPFIIAACASDHLQIIYVLRPQTQ